MDRDDATRAELYEDMRRFEAARLEGIARLEAAAAEVVAMQTVLQREKAALESAVLDLERKRDVFEHERSTGHLEVRALYEREIARLRAVVAAGSGRGDAVGSEVEALQGELADARTEIECLRVESAALAAERDGLSREVAALKSTIAAREGSELGSRRLQTLKQRAAELELEVDALARQKLQLQKSVARMASAADAGAGPTAGPVPAQGPGPALDGGTVGSGASGGSPGQDGDPRQLWILKTRLEEEIAALSRRKAALSRQVAEAEHSVVQAKSEVPSHTVSESEAPLDVGSAALDASAGTGVDSGGDVRPHSPEGSGGSVNGTTSTKPRVHSRLSKELTADVVEDDVGELTTTEAIEGGDARSHTTMSTVSEGAALSDGGKRHRRRRQRAPSRSDVVPEELDRSASPSKLEPKTLKMMKDDGKGNGNGSDHEQDTSVKVVRRRQLEAELEVLASTPAVPVEAGNDVLPSNDHVALPRRRRPPPAPVTPPTTPSKGSLLQRMGASFRHTPPSSSEQASSAPSEASSPSVTSEATPSVTPGKGSLLQRLGTSFRGKRGALE